MDAEMLSWEKVISPRVWALVLSTVGDRVDAASFQRVMKAMHHELSLTEQIEFVLVQLIFSKASGQ